MTDTPRYAIYYVAAPGSTLDRFGARLLGYDAFSNEGLPFPRHRAGRAGLARDHAAIPANTAFMPR